MERSETLPEIREKDLIFQSAQVLQVFQRFFKVFWSPLLTAKCLSSCLKSFSHFKKFHPSPLFITLLWLAFCGWLCKYNQLASVFLSYIKYGYQIFENANRALQNHIAKNIWFSTKMITCLEQGSTPVLCNCSKMHTISLKIILP